MIRASHESNGERGFPLDVAMYLAQRYGYVAGVDLRSRVAEQLALVRERLRGGSYFGGERVSALDDLCRDVPHAALGDRRSRMPMSGAARRAHASTRELIADLVPDALWTHRAMMFERHLEWPIRLS